MTAYSLGGAYSNEVLLAWFEDRGDPDPAASLAALRAQAEELDVD